MSQQDRQRKKKAPAPTRYWADRYSESELFPEMALRLTMHGTIHDVLNAYEGWAKHTLRDAGLPDDAGMYEVTDGGLVPLDLESYRARLRSGDALAWTTALGLTQDDPSTPEHCAASLLDKIEWLRRELAKPDASAERAATLTYHVLVEGTLGHFYQRVERDAYAGRKARAFGAHTPVKGGTKKGAKYRKANEEVVIPEARRLRAQHPTWTYARIAEHIKPQDPCKRSTDALARVVGRALRSAPA